MTRQAITARDSMGFRLATIVHPADLQRGDILLSGGARQFILMVHPHTTDSSYPDLTGLLQAAPPKKMEFQYAVLKIKEY